MKMQALLLLLREERPVEVVEIRQIKELFHATTRLTKVAKALSLTQAIIRTPRSLVKENSLALMFYSVAAPVMLLAGMAALPTASLEKP